MGQFPYCWCFPNYFENRFIQLYDYLNANNLLYKSKYGFRNLHSTDKASLEIKYIIMKYMDSGKCDLDWSKAFDTFDHIIL